MKRLIVVPVVLVLGLMVLMTLSYAGEKEKADVSTAIASMNKKFAAAFNRGDAAGLASLYTKNGEVLPSNSDFITGQTAIEGFWQVLVDMGLKGTLKTVELEAHGDTAIEVGTFTLQTGEGQTADEGKYVVVWKQEGGQWKLHRDIFNSSMPVPPTPAEQTAATLTHHLEAFGAGDVDKILSDYTEDSVIITPDGVLRGLDQLRPLFEKFVTEIAPPGEYEIELLQQVIDGETAYITWRLESAGYKIPFGTDTFVMRDGKILTQTFAAQIIPKK